MDIIYTKNLNSSIKAYISKTKPSSVFVLVDENTKKHCLPSVKFKFKYKTIEIPEGEKNKNIYGITKIWNELLSQKADRKSLLINLGGGIVTDMGGFAASTYKRGIKFINIPTSTLAMIDASVGGKNGINLNFEKNMIGLFANPEIVYINTQLLKTLPRKEYLNGLAEAFKHAVLSDENYFDELKKHVKTQKNTLNIIKKSIDFKKEITDLDFNENGIRKILNFGHTIGHAIETYYNLKNKNLKHGEAVILGIIGELYLSVKKEKFDNNKASKTIKDLIRIYDLKKFTDFENDKIIKYVLNDKKNQENKIYPILLKNFGNAIYDRSVEIFDIEESLDYIKELFKDN